MSATLALFERWKALKSLQSDRQAAQVLGLSHAAPAQWRAGRNGSASVVERMARDLGEDPVPVILQAFSEASRDAEDRRTLAKLARRLGAACLALLAVAPMMMHSSPAKAHEGENAQQGAAHPIHYAKSLQRRVTQFLGDCVRNVARWRPFAMERARCSHLALYPITQ